MPIPLQQKNAQPGVQQLFLCSCDLYFLLFIGNEIFSELTALELGQKKSGYSIRNCSFFVGKNDHFANTILEIPPTNSEQLPLFPFIIRKVYLMQIISNCTKYVEMDRSLHSYLYKCVENNEPVKFQYLKEAFLPDLSDSCTSKDQRQKLADYSITQNDIESMVNTGGDISLIYNSSYALYNVVGWKSQGAITEDAKWNKLKEQLVVSPDPKASSHARDLHRQGYTFSPEQLTRGLKTALEAVDCYAVERWLKLLEQPLTEDQKTQLRKSLLEQGEIFQLKEILDVDNKYRAQSDGEIEYSALSDSEVELGKVALQKALFRTDTAAVLAWLQFDIPITAEQIIKGLETAVDKASRDWRNHSSVREYLELLHCFLNLNAVNSQSDQEMLPDLETCQKAQSPKEHYRDLSSDKNPYKNFEFDQVPLKNLLCREELSTEHRKRLKKELSKARRLAIDSGHKTDAQIYSTVLGVELNADDNKRGAFNAWRGGDWKKDDITREDAEGRMKHEIISGNFQQATYWSEQAGITLTPAMYTDGLNAALGEQISCDALEWLHKVDNPAPDQLAKLLQLLISKNNRADARILVQDYKSAILTSELLKGQVMKELEETGSHSAQRLKEWINFGKREGLEIVWK